MNTPTICPHTAVCKRFEWGLSTQSAGGDTRLRMPHETSSPSAQFARVRGSAGERARFLGLVRAAIPLLMATTIGGYLVRAALPVPAMSRTAAGVLLLAVGVALIVAMYGSSRRISAFFKGARGEEEVSRELAFLPAEYTVFHGLTFRGAGAGPATNCDHVVLGPTGIHSVETKNWSGRLTLEGSRILYDGLDPTRDPVEQAGLAATALQTRLKESYGLDLAVHPLLCFADNRILGPEQLVRGVLVCDVRSVNRHIMDGSHAPLPGDVQERVCSLLESLVE